MTTPLRGHSRVLIIEHDVLLAESLEVVLGLEGYDAHNLPFPEHQASVGQLLTAALQVRPRIILLDLDLGALGDGAQLIHPLAASGANVVVITAPIDRSRWGECLHHGARQVMAKTRPLKETLAVVRRLYQGLPVLDAEDRETHLREWQNHRKPIEEGRRRLDTLTHREREILTRLREGIPVRRIADLHYVAEATVRTQVKSILMKLDVTSQIAAVGLAHNVGWRPMPNHTNKENT